MGREKMGSLLQGHDAEIQGDLARVTELLDEGGLTQWEEEFLTSLEERLGDGLRLTEAQSDKLDQIERKA